MRRFADEWLLLGLLGALLLLSLLLVHVPATLWAGNTGEFHWRFGTFLRLGIEALAAGLVAAFLILTVLPTKARIALASLLCAVAIVGWLYAFFLAGHMTALNGMDAPMRFETFLGAWELAVVAGVCLLIAFAIARAHRAATLALLVLNLGLVITTAVSVRAATRHRLRPPPATQDTAPVFRFSSRDNVLVVLLDGLQSDIAYAILRSDPHLRAAFDGFRYYRDALGVAPTTFVSLPAIHSGAEYHGQESLGAYFEESIRIQSFMNRFAEAGYQTALVNPIEGVCPALVATCPTSAQILRTGEAQLRAESLRLFDVSLFRLAPVWLKQRIYANGNWFLAGRFDMAEETSRIFEHNQLLTEMARRITVDEGPPTLKFVHSLATHTPFVLSDDCRAPLETSWARLPPQAHCALLAVAGLLDALKAAGVYDRTEIALIADHGIGQPDAFADAAALRSPAQAAWAKRAGYANPMFLLKPRGARGEITDDLSRVYLPDLGATLCASSGACTMPSGVPAGQASPDRVRRFLDYDWNHEFWQLRNIPNVTVYAVRGTLWDPRAWRRVDEGPPEGSQ
jgi:hypothetical protein